MSGVGAAVFAGRYRVVGRLGSGGSGAVFLAYDDRLGREVAIKRLHGAEVTPETAQRLQREARIMASLRHPGLVTVYDMLTEGDDLLLVMEYVRGNTLADVLEDAPLEWDRAAVLLDQIAAALDHVHAQGVVHRDLKPSNILVGSRGAVKIADLGLATAAEITNITPPGAILGTPAYMAPEQARAESCVPAVDIFALATIVFQALSGTLPRTGSTVVSILRQAEHEPPPDLRERRPGTPAAAAEALARGMARDPADRQASASELLRDLHAAFREHRPASVPPEAATATTAAPTAAQPARPAPPRRRGRGRARAAALGALALVVAALAVIVLVVRDGGSSSPRPTNRAAAAKPSPAPTEQPPATPAAQPGPKRLSAAATVRAFYRRAAAGDFPGAWRLAGPGMRQAFGGSYQRFRTDLSSLRDVTFQRVAVVGRDASGVTLEIRTVATHVDRVDHCSGTLRAVRGAGRRWVVEPAGVRCTSG
jgi:eukaryotic-like serine/threonine-protein kinase